MTRLRRNAIFAAAALTLAMMVTARVEAHLVTTDLGPFYDGAAHALVSMEDLLTILAVALLAALGGPRHGRIALASLSTAWLVGTVAAFGLGRREPQLSLVTALSLVALGVAVAANLRTKPHALALAGAAIGLFRGAMNGAAAHDAAATWTGTIGIPSGVFVVLALALGVAVWLAPRKSRIALRVAGSWLAAIGLLMAGWAIRGTS